MQAGVLAIGTGPHPHPVCDDEPSGAAGVDGEIAVTRWVERVIGTLIRLGADDHVQRHGRQPTVRRLLERPRPGRHSSNLCH